MRGDPSIHLNRFEIDEIARACVGLRDSVRKGFLPWVILLQNVMRPSIQALHLNLKTQTKIKNSQYLLQQKIGKTNVLLLIKRVNKLLLLFV
ncbi:MAG: hypothetical protein HQM15_04070 [Deltaproteobacteria bacterium]|nr:hypothetical protein [Deltaproteobacteria bacterium]